jgi:hypothetical protein
VGGCLGGDRGGEVGRGENETPRSARLGSSV